MRNDMVIGLVLVLVKLYQLFLLVGMLVLKTL
jgi:hypothetical protein